MNPSKGQKLKKNYDFFIQVVKITRDKITLLSNFCNNALENFREIKIAGNVGATATCSKSLVINDINKLSFT